MKVICNLFREYIVKKKKTSKTSTWFLSHVLKMFLKLEKCCNQQHLNLDYLWNHTCMNAIYHMQNNETKSMNCLKIYSHNITCRRLLNHTIYSFDIPFVIFCDINCWASNEHFYKTIRIPISGLHLKIPWHQYKLIINRGKITWFVSKFWGYSTIKPYIIE